MVKAAGTIAVVVASFMVCGAALSRSRQDVGRWQATHGPEGGEIAAIAVDPKHPDNVYAGAVWGGFYKSEDAGASWRPLPVDPTAAVRGALLIDPRHPRTIYAGSGLGVFKSTNGGASWRSKSAGLFGKEANDRREWRRAEGWVTRLVVDVASSNTLYAATYGGVFKTTNGGRRWRGVNAGIPWTGGPSWRLIATIATDPKHPRVLYAGRDDPLHKRTAGLFKTTDGGRHWRPAGLVGETVREVAVDPADSRNVFAATENGVFRTSSSGESWALVLRGDTRALAVDRHSATIYASTAARLYTSRDEGATWIAEAPSAPADVASLALDPRAGTTIYLGTDDGVYYKSGEHEWRAVNSGLTAASVGALAVDSASTVYAGVWGGGVFRSVDRAQSWQAGNAGLTTRNVTELAVDPRDSRVLYVGTSTSGVFKSIDGARSWQPTGLAAADITALAVAPQGPDVVYAAVFGEPSRVLRSSDGGKTWRDTGLRAAAWVLAVDPHDPDVLYAGTDRGVYKSWDAGKSWSDASAGLLRQNDDRSMAGVRSLVVGESRHVYAVTPRGLFESNDAAANWQLLNAGAEAFLWAVAVDPPHRGVLYGSGFQGVSRSTDGGRRWKPFGQGLNGRGVATLAIDARGRTIYAGTLGRGVVDADIG